MVRFSSPREVFKSNANPMKEGSVSKRIDRPLSHRPDQGLDQGEVLGMARRERLAPPEAAAPHRWLGRAAELGVATAATREDASNQGVLKPRGNAHRPADYERP